MALPELVSATLSARARLSDPSVGTRVSKGRIQVVRVTFVGRKSTVIPCSDWLSMDQAVETLNALEAAQ